MNDISIQRLKMTLRLTKQSPNTLIIITGGVPKNCLWQVALSFLLIRTTLKQDLLLFSNKNANA